MRRAIRALPWIAWLVAIPLLWVGCPGQDAHGEPRPYSFAHDLVTVAAVLTVVAAHIFSAIYLFVAIFLPADGWRPLTGDMFAWFRPWFPTRRGHAIAVASWRAAYDILRTRLAALGYTEAVAAANGERTATMVLAHADDATFATITVTIDASSRMRLAFVSLLEGDTLFITANDVEKHGGPTGHDALPIAPGALVQVLDDDLPPGSLLGEHARTLTWLAEHGAQERRATLDELTSALAAATARRRRTFLANPVINMFLVAWRGGVRGWRPDRGELRDQPDAPALIAAAVAAAVRPPP